MLALVCGTLLASNVAHSQRSEEAAALDTEIVRLHEAGQYAEAIKIAKRLLESQEKALGPAHLDVAISLNNLGELYKSQGRYSEAEPLYQRSISILEKALGPEHPDGAVFLINLADLKFRQGHYAMAESFYKRSIAIRETALGAEHSDVKALYGLGDLVLFPRTLLRGRGAL